MVVSNRINQMYEEMKTWRQDLHRIPEIGLEEYETSQYIKSKLSEFKIEFKDGYANTGIVACICLLYTSPSPRDQRGSRLPGWG